MPLSRNDAARFEPPSRARLRHLAAALTATLALGACGGVDEAIRDFEALGKEACPCADKACADAALAKLRVLADQHKDARGRHPADVERLSHEVQGVSTCLVARGVTIEQLRSLSDGL